MTQSYKRRRQGGRYKQRDAGQAGVRAIREQAQTTIDSMKQQQAREVTYGEQRIRGQREVGRGQSANLQILHDLDNKIYSNKRSQIKKRRDTEFSKLQGQADLLNKTAAYWKDLAPKFSKNITQLGTGIASGMADINSDYDFKELIQSGQFDELTSFLDSASQDQIKELVKKRDEAWNNKDTVAVDYLGEVLNQSSSQLSEKIVNHLIKNTDNLEADLKKYVTNDSQDLNSWDEDSVQDFYDMRARELVRSFGLGNTKAASKLITHFHSAGAVVSKQLEKDRLVREGTDQRFKAKDDVVSFSMSNDPEKAKTAVKTGTITYHNSWVKVGDKEVQLTDVREAHLMHLRDVAATGNIDSDKLKELFLDSCTPGTQGEGCVTWRKRHGAALEEQVDTIILESIDGFRQKVDKRNKGTDAVQLADFEHALAGTGAYAKGKAKEQDALVNGITTVQEYEKVVARYRAEEGNNKTRAAIAKLLHLDPSKPFHDRSALDRLWRAHLNNDIDEVSQIWMRLDATQRAKPQIANLYKASVALNSSPDGKGSVTEIKDWATKAIKHQIGIQGALTQKVHPSGFEMIPHLQQSFYSNFNRIYEKVGDDEPIDGIIEKAKELASADLIAESGIFQTQEASQGAPGSDVYKKFIHGLPPKTNRLSGTDLYSTINRSEANLSSDAILGTEETDGVITKTELKEVAFDVQQDKTVTIPRNMHILYNEAGGMYNGKKLTKTEYFNMLLEKNGFSQRLRDGHHEYLNLKAEQLWSHSIGSHYHVTDKNVLPINIFADIVNQTGQMPMSSFLRGSTIQEQLENEIPDYQIDSEVFDDGNTVYADINSKTWKDIFNNKNKLGLKIKFGADGNFEFMRK